MTVNPDLDHLRGELERDADLLPPDIDLRFRPMFGGLGVYANERMFASISNIGLALKLPPEPRADLLREPGAKPLQYAENAPVSKESVIVPAAIRADPAHLAKWATLSIEYTASLPAPKPKGKRKAAS
ncbi:MAG: TfoX/Sxy family protein [Chloroflexota bacterium]|nr:TfoX/Sxy family protein [Chloroflexota bacterium]